MLLGCFGSVGEDRVYKLRMACMQVLKLVKKAAKRKQVKRGVKEVIKAIRKKTTGYGSHAVYISRSHMLT